MRSVFEWNLGSRSLQLGKRTLLMGVVNVTPDSFSDGGLYYDRDRAVEHALKLLEEGADIIDIGGESTRPGAQVVSDASGREGRSADTRSEARRPVSEAEELKRVIPVIQSLKQTRPEAIVSVDTYKSTVARVAIEAGAEIVNDVSGLRLDRQMTRTLRELTCGVVLMHMRGNPEEWRNLPPVEDVVLLVKRELRESANAALREGIKQERLVLDPGFGFGKNFEENYPLLKRFEEFADLRYPLLAGGSRKSFLGRALARNGKDAPIDGRLWGTIAMETAIILKGAHIIRTHDVRASADARKIADIVAS
jgi:dihydropteroate synthase